MADYLLDVASDPPVGLFPMSNGTIQSELKAGSSSDEVEKGLATSPNGSHPANKQKTGRGSLFGRTIYAATFLTQFQVLSGREWKILRRDKTLFFLHVAVASVLGVFCGRCLGLSVRDWSDFGIVRWPVLPHRHHHRWLPVTSRLSFLPGRSFLPGLFGLLAMLTYLSHFRVR